MDRARPLYFFLVVLAGIVVTRTVVAEEEGTSAIQALLITGGCSHDYERRKEVIVTGIRERVKRKIEWKVRLQGLGESDEKIPIFEESGWADGYDIVVHDYCFPRVSDGDYIDNILSPHQKGTPAVLIHGTLQSFRIEDDRWTRFCGAESREHDTEHSFGVGIESSDNPIVEGIDEWTAVGGQLYRIEKEEPGITRLTSSPSPRDGSVHLTSWSHLYGPEQARVFSTTIGNDIATMQQTEWLDMVARGFLWALDDLSEESFELVTPDESLKGLTLTEVGSKLPQVGRNAALSGSADAVSSDIPANPPSHAVDGDSATYWRASRPGPASWSVRLPVATQVEFLAFVWDGVAPATYSIEVAEGENIWKLLAEKQDSSLRKVDLIAIPSTKVSKLRLNVPFTANGVAVGIREFAAYRSLDEVPAALREVAGAKVQDLESNAPEESDTEVSGGYPHRLKAELPEGERGVQMIATAKGGAFVLTENAENERSIFSVRYSKEDEIEVVTFLENLDEFTGAAWDGEWLYVLEDFRLTAYRDTNRDGAADEKFVHGLVCVAEDGNDLDVRFDGLHFGNDGWIYAEVESLGEEKGYCSWGHELRFPRHGIVRFRRDGSGMTIVMRSERDFENFLPTAGGGFLVVIGEESEAGQLFNLPPMSVPDWDRIQPVLRLAPGEKVVGAGFGEQFVWIASNSRISRYDILAGESESKRLSLKDAAAACTSFEGQLWAMCGKGGKPGEIWHFSEGSSQETVDLDRVSNDGLIPLLSHDSSSVRREASVEILRRRRFPETAVFDAIANRDASVEEIRALLATAELIGSKHGFEAVAALTQSEVPEVRASAFLTLADFSDSENHAIFGKISQEKSPYVTSRIIAAILRSRTLLPGMDRLALELASESDPLLSVSATSFLIERNAMEVCFDVLDNEGDEKLWPTAFRILTQFHKPRAVEGIVLRLEQTNSPEFRSLAFDALSALYYEPSGGKTPWEATPLIDAVFRASLLDKRVNRISLLDLMVDAEIPLNDAELLVELGSSSVELESFAVSHLVGLDVPAQASPWLSRVWDGDARDPDLRVRALALLCGMQPEASVRDLFGSVAEAVNLGVSEKTLNLLYKNWLDVPREDDIGWLISQSKSSNPERSSLAFQMLLDIRAKMKEPSKAREQIDEEWEKLAKGEGTRKQIWEDAKGWYSEREHDAGDEEGGISELSSAELAKLLSPGVGQEGSGKRLFSSLGCAACHNVNGEGPGVGPSLLHGETKKDLHSLLESIRNPSKEVHPQFIARSITLEDGRRWKGLVEWENDEEVVLRDAAANIVTLEKDEVSSERELKESLMPDGVVDYLSIQEWNDLLAYLKTLSI